MTESQIKNIFFAIISCLLFFCDIILFASMQSCKIHLLLCFFITLINKPYQNRTIVFPLLLLSIFSYLQINIFGWSLTYVIPSMLVTHYLQQHLHVKNVIPYTVLIFALTLQNLLNFYLHAIATSYQNFAYTVAYNCIFITVMITMISYIQTKLETMREKIML